MATIGAEVRAASVRVVDHHELYIENSPFYRALYVKHGRMIPVYMAEKVARQHGIEIASLGLEVKRTSIGAFVSTVAFVMELGY